MIVPPRRVIDRFWARVDVGSPQECWPWKLGTANGYGKVGWSKNGKTVMTTAHAVAWIAAGRRLLHEPETIDHICRNRACCNPGHLRVLTRFENSSRNAQKLRSHCPAGHPYSGANTYWDGRGRQCRACARTNAAKRMTAGWVRVSRPRDSGRERRNIEGLAAIVERRDDRYYWRVSVSRRVVQFGYCDSREESRRDAENAAAVLAGQLTPTP